MKTLVTDLRDMLVSLKLTVVLLVLGMILIFAGTLDQVNLGVWAVQAKYFRSFVITAKLGGVNVPIFPGGYVVGGLLLANLIAAHVWRFAFTWRKAGIFLAHAGLIVLLVGELLSGLWQEDFTMRLSNGQKSNYAESFREYELALIDSSAPAYDDIVAVPQALLARRATINDAKVPFRIAVKTYYANAALQPNLAQGMTAASTEGFGARVVALPQPEASREGEQSQPAAVVELSVGGRSLGTWLVTPLLVMPQEFTHDGHTWRLELRLKRSYQPFSLTLVKFSHDRYAGTDIPKNFSSRLRLTSADGLVDREVLVYMNNPLRYGGLTFYQAGFANDDRTTILQVVRNPSWILPYVACALMTVGLVVQFGIHLFGFAARRRTAVAGATLPAAVAP